ncbi:MAG: hypothetical protein AAF487_11930 [Bacteroidota bacterium]
MEKAKYLIITCFIFIYGHVFSQKCINVEYPENGTITLTKEIQIPKVNSGYTLWLPSKDTANGMLVFFHGRRDTASADALINMALENQLAVLYVTTDNPVEFLFKKSKMQFIEQQMNEVCTNYGIPQNALLFCGMSLAGTRALKQSLFYSDSLSKYRIRPRAIAVCDAPLDMIRFHKEAVKSGQLAFHPLAANEGIWTSQYLEKNLGGPPKDAIHEYLDYSIYSYIGGAKNLGPIRSTWVRAYTEPDVHWWIETRRKDYYGMNAIDLAALVNELKIMGNSHAELVTTRSKGYKPDGQRHPHSWSIVDEKELIQWFVNILSN